MSSEWTSKPKATPKPTIDLRERLHWVKYIRDDEIYLWPAVLYTDFDEFQCHLQDRLDNEVRTKIALEILGNFHAGKKVMVARLLGRGDSLDFLQIPEGSDFYMYSDKLQWIASEGTHPKVFAKHLDLYMQFMGALDESLNVLGGNESNRWRELGEERLSSFQSSLEKPPQEAEQTETNEQPTSSTNEGEEPQSSGDEKTPAPANKIDTSITPSAAPKNTIEALADDQSLPAERIGEHAASSSATVVSISDYSSAETEEQPVYQVPEEIEDAKNFQEVGAKLIFASWERRQVGDEVLYFPPGVGTELTDTHRLGKEYFNELALRKYLAENFQWKEQEETRTDSTTTEEFIPRTSPRRNDALQPKQSGKKHPKKKANSKASKVATPQITRNSKKRDKPLSFQDREAKYYACKEKAACKENDDFYKFKPLVIFLQKHLNWDYKPAKNRLKEWSYIKGDSEAGEDGVYLVDFFHEEKEVIDYCKKNNYKKKYAHLAKNEGDRATNPKRAKTEASKSTVDPAFITPPPMKKKTL